MGTFGGEDGNDFPTTDLQSDPGAGDYGQGATPDIGGTTGDASYNTPLATGDSNPGDQINNYDAAAASDAGNLGSGYGTFINDKGEVESLMPDKANQSWGSSPYGNSTGSTPAATNTGFRGGPDTAPGDVTNSSPNSGFKKGVDTVPGDTVAAPPPPSRPSDLGDAQTGAGAGTADNQGIVTENKTGGSILGDIAGGITKGLGSVLNGIGQGIGSVLGAFGGTDPNGLMSSFRMQGIPYGAEVSYGSGNTMAEFSTGAENKDWRVKISSNIIYQSNAMAPLAVTGGMVFPYLPTITMNHTAVYEAMPVVHTNYQFQAYKNSQVEDIVISGKFTVQDMGEGMYWLAMMHFLRSATKMYFGQGPNLGNPPPICTLNGYGDFVYKNVAVVIKSFSIQLADDVDYISVNMGQNGVMNGTGSQISYVPTLSTVSVTVSPVISREKLKSFNLTAFASGQLVTAPDGKGFI
jgi:hypothetical protein